MNPAEIFALARSHGVRFALDGDRLCLRSSRPIQAAVTDAVLSRRDEIVLYVRAESMSLAEEADLRVQLFVDGTEAGWPELQLRPAETLGHGLSVWARFLRRATPERLLRVEVPLAAHTSRRADAMA